MRSIPTRENDCGYEIYFRVETPELALKFSEKLNEHNVNCRKMTRTYPHYTAEYCLERTSHTPAANVFGEETVWPAEGYREEDFPRTNRIISHFVVIPLGPKYTIEDADYATEVANMTRAQILQQAGTSVLAQANQIPQSVLSLLG
jgi:dTDP-4-amino-4,6-dideoxygalactose transaminase